ncbi:hypothetical protein [Chromobacterium amazonense]|uniref:Uncharacterized protein n=1 Tax=Chromobacterium amazonense TaxID=1382803 RepID=A0ABU8V8F6_9NEIS|nr:hypothetical protein [Chromobacterium amazonense]MDQ4539093.1 hypothetical protein [Chromobacterium amazonense]
MKKTVSARKKPFILISLAICAVVFGVVVMNNSNNSSQSTKIVNQIRDHNGEVTDYVRFINDGMSKKIFNSIERDNLENFISKNMDVLAGSVSDKEMIESDPNVQFEYFVPKLITAPVTVADMQYTFIVTQPTPTSKGVVGDFFGSVERKDENAPWEYGYIPLRNGYISPLTNFDQKVFDRLGLKFSEKFFLSDLKSGKRALDFYQSTDYKKFSESGDNDANFAFYKFTTTRNSIPLSVVFGVLENQYDESAEFPRNWFDIYMKREG